MDALAPMGIHHVGIAVDDLDAAIERYSETLGARLELRARVEEQGVEAASLRIGDGIVELIAPLDGDTPVGRFLARSGPGLHHVAYRVESVRAALAALAVAGVELIDSEPRIGLHGLAVAFLHPSALFGTLVELVEDAGSTGS